VRRTLTTLLILFSLIGVVGGCGSGDDSSTALTVPERRDPSIPAEASEYCALVEEFYERLGSLIGRSADQDELDDKFIGFVREQQSLFNRLAASAPEEIATAAAIQRDAFAEVARTGTTQAFETEGYLAAERDTVRYEEEVCGIVV
jgi:hypothetical protein